MSSGSSCDPPIGLWDNISARADQKYATRGVDQYLSVLPLSRLEFGLISMSILDPCWTLPMFVRDASARGKGGLLNVAGGYSAVGDVSASDIDAATHRLIERSFLRICTAEEAEAAQQMMNSGLPVFPDVEVPSVETVTPTPVAQSIWYHVYHRMLKHGRDVDVTSHEGGQTVVTTWAARPVSERDCRVSSRDRNGPCLKCRGETSCKEIGPAMDYWWHICPRAFVRTCRIPPEADCTKSGVV
jgi:hypothetical protein